MTFDEFRALALNPPQREEETIFEVVEYWVATQLIYLKTLYPKFRLSHKTIGFAHSVGEAEELIRAAIRKDCEYKRMPYCFYIKEYPVGSFMCYMWGDYAVSMRLYNSEGILIDRTYCSSLCSDFRTPYGLFRGRKKEALRFKKGDIVEVRDGDEVYLAVVASEDMTIERCWEYRAQWAVKYRGSENDSASVLAAPNVRRDGTSGSGCNGKSEEGWPDYDSHYVHALNIMALSYPLPEKMRRRYRGYYTAMLEKERQERLEEERWLEERRRETDMLVSFFGKYRDKPFDISPYDALKLLARLYVRYCGISLGIRTVVYDSASYWMARLAESEHPLADMAESESFVTLIPELLDDDEVCKEWLNNYDIASMEPDEEILTAGNALEEITDERERIVFCIGFQNIIEDY